MLDCLATAAESPAASSKYVKAAARASERMARVLLDGFRERLALFHDIDREDLCRCLPAIRRVVGGSGVDLEVFAGLFGDRLTARMIDDNRPVQHIADLDAG